ncbi:uncharacterized protein PAC_11089 [Phialocephala subalpina]|uniref:Seipin n=1 Tax=Phialocephala subalpina TaxID=576137 RepID=A0A1L7X848_9HELO|nr:uncharacterized protein PAC_11089 [Phialocephala subalpina]
MDLIMKPARVATSKPAVKTYLNAVLFMITSAILLGLASLAYILFYLNYVPQIGIERIIHLQYGDGPHPYGITSLDSSLISQQAYDISLSLHVPRSPSNLAQGNFMLSLSLLSPSYNPSYPSISPAYSPKLTTIYQDAKDDVLFFSRRPAILTYSSRLVSSTETLFALPLYIFGLKRESEILHVPMAELATFPKGWKNIPAYAMLELQSEQEVQVYDVRIQFKARFGGLRWVMYNHRIVSFVVFTFAFWMSECLFAILGWLALQAIFAKSPEQVKEVKGDETDTATIKNEEEEDEPDLSDTPRTFPTYGRQPPLRYTPKTKDEDSEEYVMDETAIQPLAAEADDEDDEEFQHRSGRTDSGIGTSFSEGGERSGVKRRTSRGGR